MFIAVLLVIAKPLETTQESKNKRTGWENGTAIERDTMEAWEGMHFWQPQRDIHNM